MRVAVALYTVALVGLASGCGSRQEPGQPRGLLVAGKLEGGTFWKNPLTAANNEGGGYASGSRVEVYDQFVVVTTQDGLSHVHPHGHYSGLVIRRD